MAEYSDEVVHEADGIQELDNKLPRWWVLLFYITIVFAVMYLAFFHVLGFGDLQHARYAREVARAEARLATRQAQSTSTLDYDQPSFDAEILAQGSSLYTTHCAACHHSTGRGLIGPNLTDAYWIHGPNFADTMHVIAEGVQEKGMQPWKNMLSLNQRYAIASYVFSLRGSEPETPRAPEGEFVEGSDNPRWGM